MGLKAGFETYFAYQCRSYSYVVIEMPTTVQVDEKTLQMLNRVKKEMKAKSHDE